MPRLLLPYIADRKASYGYDDVLGLADPEVRPGARKKVIVEMSSPNMADDFNVGHLRSTLIGSFLANLYRGMGWDVVRMNYLGDWGKQIGLLAVGYERFASEEEFARDPNRHLLEINHRINELFKPEQDLVKAAKSEHRDVADIESSGLHAERDAFFKRMEDKDEAAVALWQRFRDATVARYKDAYARIGVTFDEYSGESQVSAESIAEVEAALKEKGVYEETDGSWQIDFAKHEAKGLSMAVMRYRNGTTSYPLRDVAAVLDRYKTHHFDKMLYVVAMEQDMHFQRVVKTLELMGREDLAAKIQHVSFAKITAQHGELDGCVLLDNYVDKATESARQTLIDEGDEGVFLDQDEQTLQRLGVSCLLSQDLTHKRTGSYGFDTKKMTTFEGETGMMFQNCYARLVRQLSENPITEPVDFTSLEYAALETENHSDLLRVMVQFPDAASSSFRTLESPGVIGYIGRLVEQIEYALQDDESEDWEGRDGALEVRMVLYEAARQVLENSMRLVGMTPIGA